jgi:shikimate dehydrogenase
MIDAATKLYCIIGNPIKHSFSPAIHNAAFQKLGINAVYTAFEVSDLRNAIAGIKALGISGASVTIPHKVAIIPFLDEVSDIAGMIGSVNTIVNNNGKLAGANTDAYGFYHSLSLETIVDEKTIAVIGSGGSARAACFALFYYARPKKLIILARNASSREEIKNNLLQKFPGLDTSQIETADISIWKIWKDKIDIVVNTTPIGMKPDVNSSPLDLESMPENRIAMDLIYNPAETLFLKRAKDKKCVAISGIEMLLHQGIQQFEIWTEEKAPVEVMRKALKKSPPAPSLLQAGG